MDSPTKCWGVVGKDDVAISCLAEEESDALMHIFPGRSDIASSIEGRSFYKVSHYFKYKGYHSIPDVDISTSDIEKYKETLYELACGIVNENNRSNIEKLLEMNLILGEEEVFDFEKAKMERKGEFILGVYLPISRIEVVKRPCEIFEEECLKKNNLLKNPSIKSVYFSSGGVAVGISLHYILHVEGTLWEVSDMALEQIHKPLSNMGIECRTRIIPIIEYLSDLEYEALLYTSIRDPIKRRQLREVINDSKPLLEKDAPSIRRLSLEDINNVIKIYTFREKLVRILGRRESDIKNEIIKFIYALTCAKTKQASDADLWQIFGDFSNIYLKLANKTEELLEKNQKTKMQLHGENKFKEAVSQAAKKEIEIKTDLGSMIIIASIWNSNYPDDPIVDQNYSNFVKKLQTTKAFDIRNVFAHGSESRTLKILNDKNKVKDDADKVVAAFMALVEFVDRYSKFKG